MPWFRKKPVIVAAHQWFKNGDHPMDGCAMPFPSEGKVVRRYRDPGQRGFKVCEHCAHTFDVHGWIDTFEGGHIVCPGDWIITGVKGERYPCKPDIFEETYEEVEGYRPKHCHYYRNEKGGSGECHFIVENEGETREPWKNDSIVVVGHEDLCQRCEHYTRKEPPVKAETNFVCKHCGKDNCYEHCQKTEDGRHEADPMSGTIPPGCEFLVDYTCKHCGQSGSLAVAEKDIMWE